MGSGSPIVGLARKLQVGGRCALAGARCVCGRRGCAACLRNVHISLQLLSEMTLEEQLEVGEVIGELDVPVGGTVTAAELMEQLPLKSVSSQCRSRRIRLDVRDERFEQRHIPSSSTALFSRGVLSRA